jgi:hypothetical protein
MVKANSCPVTRDAIRRTHLIRYLVAMQGKRVRDLHREFCARGRGCHWTVFYRVVAQQRRSARIENWLARRLRTKRQELFQ